MNILKKHTNSLIFKIFLPIFLGFLSICVFCFPIATEMMQFDRDCLMKIQLWRLITGHFTHFSVNHLVWDLVVFVSLGIACSVKDMKKFVTVVILSPLIISIIIWFVRPDIQFYRGLSGIDSALFTLFALNIMKESLKQGKKDFSFFMGIIMILSITSKTIFEYISVETLFTSSANFIPLPLAHLAGIISALLIFNPYLFRKIFSFYPKIGKIIFQLHFLG
ncbi:MAG: rhombosortase [Verrucomicrobiota bacterium]|nr:rhombosortase [Verrucomicrobiota bacterium]